MIYCFLDTNIFLQYQIFDEIPWLDVLSADSVCLVIPKKVIQELDKHKNDPTSNRRRKRASTALQKMYKYFTESNGVIRSNITLNLQTNAPLNDWLETNGYNPHDNDDCIVGAVHFYQSNNPNVNLILLTGDYGVRLKALANMIPQQILSDDYKLSPEPDPLQKENQELQRELQRLKNRKPDLLLQFQGDANMVVFQVDFNEIELTTKEIDQRIQEQFDILKYENPSLND